MADQALLIGINDYKRVPGLLGCLNDVAGMHDLLTVSFGFSASGITTLTDFQAVKGQVVEEIQRLLASTGAGDRLVIHFSGHGARVPDDQSDKPDRVSEIICLHDMDPTFTDSSTWLADHELRDLLKNLHPASKLLVVFDSCHSGSATRALPLALANGALSARGQAPLVTARSVAANDAPAIEGSPSDLVDTLHDSQVVMVRQITAPADVAAEIEQRRSRKGSFGRMSRALVDVPDLNYVFLAACAPGETAADALIEGERHGAFTYYLCQEVGTLGQDVELPVLEGRLDSDLQSYEQDPQVEASPSAEQLFNEAHGDGAPVGPATPDDPGTPDDPATPGDSGAPDDASAPPAASPSSAGPSAGDPDLVREALRTINRIIDLVQGQPEAGRGIPAPVWHRDIAGPTRRDRSVAGRYLVYIHGVGVHTAGYSDAWWNAMSHYTPSLAQANRVEVLWSDIVNSRSIVSRDLTPDQSANLTERIREILEDRARNDIERSAPRPRAVGGRPTIARAVAGRRRSARRDLDLPAYNFVNDFAVYLLNNSVRDKVTARFTDSVRPLLTAGAEVEIISHSWGTVVAYEGLVRLEAEGLVSGMVPNFFTVGAALSIPPIKSMLIPSAKDGHRPVMVRRWVNLDARFDIVGGSLAGNPYEVDPADDFVNLDPVGCSSWFPEPGCAHRSYFNGDNTAVNRDIFGSYIES